MFEQLNSAPYSSANIVIGRKVASMKRNAYLDNLKFILIFFVVLGHFANLNRMTTVFGILNNIIYSFHMPLFVFVSGYLSKNIDNYRRKEISQVLYAYFVLEALNIVFTKLTPFGQGGYNIFIPTGQNWYLLGIFFWRLFLPYFLLYNRYLSLAAAIFIAFIIGIYDEFNTFLGLYRIICFMPFFLLGIYCRDIILLLDKYGRFRLLCISILILSLSTVAVLSSFDADLNKAIAYAFTPFKGYGSQNDREFYLRFGLRIIGFAVSIIISFCFLFVVPLKKTFFTSLGKNTLNVYLLHMFIVLPIDWYFKKFNLDISVMLPISIISSVLITLFLSSDIIGRIFSPFTDGLKAISIVRLRPSQKELTQKALN